MSDAIEVLKKFVKDCNECCVDDVPYRQPVEDAINKAIIALEQKDKLKKWLDKNIKKKENLLEKLIESKDDCLNDLIEQEKEEDEILSVQEYWNKKIGEMNCEKITLEEVLKELEGVEK